MNKNDFKSISQIKAVFFDMDGTIVDSEIGTEISSLALLRENNIEAGDFDFTRFHGVTWRAISEQLLIEFPKLGNSHKDVNQIIKKLQDGFHDYFKNHMAYIPGSPDAITKAGQYHHCAIVTSSNKDSVEYLVEEMNLRKVIDFYLWGELYHKSKPDPECYLMAAERLNLKADNCLVFEDSIAGLAAAKNAGMTSIAITFGKKSEVIKSLVSDFKIDNYNELPTDFFENIQY